MHYHYHIHLVTFCVFHHYAITRQSPTHYHGNHIFQVTMDRCVRVTTHVLYLHVETVQNAITRQTTASYVTVQRITR